MTNQSFQMQPLRLGAVHTKHTPVGFVVCTDANPITGAIIRARPVVHNQMMTTADLEVEGVHRVQGLGLPTPNLNPDPWTLQRSSPLVRDKGRGKSNFPFQIPS